MRFSTGEAPPTFAWGEQSEAVMGLTLLRRDGFILAWTIDRFTKAIDRVAWGGTIVLNLLTFRLSGS
ncbi:MAG: hypothetical protein NT070_08530 [Cyanobacteria bacterium]|nr:hypothetical protein [Cyanobacteriota bacterium]